MTIPEWGGLSWNSVLGGLSDIKDLCGSKKIHYSYAYLIFFQLGQALKHPVAASAKLCRAELSKGSTKTNQVWKVRSIYCREQSFCSERLEKSFQRSQTPPRCPNDSTCTLEWANNFWSILLSSCSPKIKQHQGVGGAGDEGGSCTSLCPSKPPQFGISKRKLAHGKQEKSGSTAR